MTLMIARSAGAVPIKCAEHLDRHHTSRRSSPGHALPSALGNVLSRRDLAQPAHLPSLPAARRTTRIKPPAAAADIGGGGGSGNGAGGSGGGGSGDGFSGGDSVPGWDARRIWTLIYAVSLIGGGLYAYKKKGSKASLYASSAVGICLLAAVWQMEVYPQAGMGIALVTSAALTVAMGNRYRKSRKFMPSGLVALVSLFSASWYANWPQ